MKTAKEVKSKLKYIDGEPQFDYETLVIELLVDIRELLKKCPSKV